MNKMKTNNNNNRLKSAKIRNYDSNIINQEIGQRRTSKLDDIYEFRQLKGNHVQFASDNNVTVVKENDKKLKSAISKTKNINNNPNLAKSNELNSNNSFDSNDFIINQQDLNSVKQTNLKIDSRSIRDKWKSSYRAVKQKLKSKPKYEEVEEIETNETEIRMNEDDNSTVSDSTGSSRISERRMSGDTQRRHTKENLDDNKSTGKKFTNNNSYIRSAIPCFPLTLAIICFILNFILPGTGMEIYLTHRNHLNLNVFFF